MYQEIHSLNQYSRGAVLNPIMRAHDSEFGILRSFSETLRDSKRAYTFQFFAMKGLLAMSKSLYPELDTNQHQMPSFSFLNRWELRLLIKT